MQKRSKVNGRDEWWLLLCRETTKPRGQQPILRFAPTEAAIEARPPRVFYHGWGNDTNSQRLGGATLPMPFAELPRRIGKVDPDRRIRNINPNPVTPAKAGAQPTPRQPAEGAMTRCHLDPGLRRGDGEGERNPQPPSPRLPRRRPGAQAGAQPTAPQRTTSAVPRAYLGPGLRRGDGLELGIV